MWIALGVVGALWFAGMAIWPDKNAPPLSQTLSQNPRPHTASASAPATEARGDVSGR